MKHRELSIDKIPYKAFKDYLSYVYVIDYVSINDAVTSIGSSNKTILIMDAQTLTANLIIPSNIGLVIMKGGSIVKASTYTITINGYFEAGLYQVFSGFSSGNVTFGAGSVEYLHPEWWGAIPGSTDSTSAIQLALSSGLSKTIKLSGGYTITSKIIMSPLTSLRIKGDGIGIGQIYSNANISMLEIDTTLGDIYYAELADFSFINACSGTRTSVVGVNITGTHNFYRSNLNRLQFMGTYKGIFITSDSAWLNLSRILFDNYGSNSIQYAIHRINAGDDAQLFMENITAFLSVDGAGFHSTGTGSVGDLTIANSTFDNGNYGIYIDGTDANYASNIHLWNIRYNANVWPVVLKNVNAIRGLGQTCSAATTLFTLQGTVTNYLLDQTTPAGASLISDNPIIGA